MKTVKKSASELIEEGLRTSRPWVMLNDRELLSVPEDIRLLREIKSLELCDNSIDELPSWFADLQNLERLDLSGNRFREIPKIVFSLTNLKELRVGRNAIEVLPPEIEKLVNLEVLDLDTNLITQLPPEIGSLGNLLELNVMRLKLTTLPSELGQLKRLSWLLIGPGKFEVVPEAVLQLEGLKRLRMASCCLNEVPAELAQLPSLESLLLDNNLLTTFPEEIFDMAGLKDLVLRGSPGLAVAAERGKHLRSFETNDFKNGDLWGLRSGRPRQSDAASLQAAIEEAVEKTWNCVLENFPTHEFTGFSVLTGDGCESIKGTVHSSAMSLRGRSGQSLYVHPVTFFETLVQPLLRLDDFAQDDVNANEQEVERRMNACFAALQSLDERGVFPSGNNREKFVLNVENESADPEQRLLAASRLNPPSTSEWFARTLGADNVDFEAAEPGDELHMWADPADRKFFAIDVSNDIWQRHSFTTFDGERFVELSWPTVRTSVDGITWVDQTAAGLDGVDNRGLASSNGRYATVVWDIRDDGSAILLATSDDFSEWTLTELAQTEDAYPIDIAMSGDNVGVLLGAEDEGVAAVVYDGAVGEPLTRSVIAGDGVPASIVGVAEGFAVGLNVAGDVLPQTEVWTSSRCGEWGQASALPDNLIGQLNSVGDSLVVTGIGRSDVEVFGAVSTDFGQTWERVEIDPEIGHVYSGPAGLISLFDGKVLFSANGSDWVELSDERLAIDTDSGGFVQVRPVTVGEGELIVYRFEDGNESFFAIELPS